MRTSLSILVLMALLAVPTRVEAVKAAQDMTPLLFDRVRAFDAVVVASLPDGFEKKATPVKHTNGVYIGFKVVRTIKGALKAGASFRISCHNQLPTLLAKRDKGKEHTYLLAVKMSKKYGWLGAGNLYGALNRFCPTTPSLEKTAKAFIAAKDTSSKGLLALCAGLLADRDLSSEAGTHVNALLLRALGSISFVDPGVQKASRNVLTLTQGRVKRGQSVGSGIRVLLVLNTADIKGNVRAVDESLAKPARTWLTAELGRLADLKWPGTDQIAEAAAAIELFGMVKDTKCHDVLAQVAKDPKWSAASSQAAQTLAKLFGAKAEAALKQALAAYDKRGREQQYNALIDTLQQVGKGEGLKKKAVPLRWPRMH
jgi:hypothetical protein